MSLQESVPLAPSMEMRGSPLPHRAKNCPTIPANVHAIVARAIWPDKTAENWAAAAGKEPGAGKVWLRGQVSGDAKLALIRLLD